MKKRGEYFLSDYKNKLIFSLIIGILISGITLFFAFKNVPFNELLNYIRIIDYRWIFPSFAILFASYIFRAARWQIIVSSSHKINFKSAYHALMTGFMINCLLPGRAGEIARPLILQKNDKIPFTAGLATVAAERVFDVVLLLAFFSAVLANVEIDPEFEIRFNNFILNRETLESIFTGMIKLSILLISGIIILSIEKIRNIMKKAVIHFPLLLFFLKEKTKQKIIIKICQPLVNILDSIASGFVLLKSPVNIGLCIGLSVLIWLLNAFSFYIFSKGCPGINLSFIEISAVMILICIFIALPSVPGFWGLWEAGGVFAMSLFGVLQKDAAGFTLANHAVQVFPVIILGALSAAALGVNFIKISYEKTI